MAGFVRGWVGLSLLAALAAPLYFLVAALGTKFGLLDWRVGFGAMTFQYGPLVILGVLAFAAIGLVLAVLIPPRDRWGRALLAVAIPAAMAAGGLSLAQGARLHPPIHDVSTNLDDPPAFSARVQAERAKVPGVNSLDFATKAVPPNPRFGGAAGKPMIMLHREGYGDLSTIIVPAAPDETLDIVEEVAAKQGWTITSVDPQAGVLEAEVTSFWFGFTDDIVVRVRPKMEAPPAALSEAAEVFEPREADASLVDVRSVSRVGVSDLGANAKRVRKFRDELATTMAAAATGG